MNNQLYQGNTNQKNAHVAILVSDETDWDKNMRNTESHFIIMKESLLQEDKTMWSNYTALDWQLQRHMGDFTTLLFIG